VNGPAKVTPRSFLVIDDQDSFRDQLAELLRSAGHEVVSVARLSSISERRSARSFDYAVLNLRVIGGRLAVLGRRSIAKNRGKRPAPVQSVPTLAQVEWAHVQWVVDQCAGNISEAARQLGIARRTLQLKLKKVRLH
jgi:ActR/RegA family two-component response regulator